jgi:hypothetical protein
MRVSRRCSTFLVGAALGSLLLACPRKTTAQRGRSVPVCATQDCATGRILDDGCTDDGQGCRAKECVACVNACPSLPAAPTPPSLAPVHDASSNEPREGGDGTLDGGDAAPDAAPAPPRQLRLLAGDETTVVFWLPVKGDFPFEDLLLDRQGRYYTHIHHHIGCMGNWRMDGDTITLDGWMGDELYVISDVHVDEHELRGVGGDLVMRRKVSRVR